MTFSTPVHLDASNRATPLERVRLGQSQGDGSFQEDWLQELLFKHPETIPFRDVDPGLGRVVAVCREMSTPAGPIDLVFITAAGKIVLAETKLFRNPEARRAVIGQILDYAKELTSWRYEQFAAKVASATGKGSAHLLDLVRGSEPNFDEARFVDSVNLSLSRADMTLLIIGDGITSGAEALVAFLEKHGGLQFSFGLIEVAVFNTPEGGRFIQPRVLAKTELLRRMLLIDREGSSVSDVAPDGVAELGQGPNWFTTFWGEFINRLRLDDLSQPTPPKPPRGTNIYYPMPPSGTFAWVSAFVASGTHEVGVYLVLSASYEPFKEIFTTLQGQRLEIEAEIGAPLEWKSAKSLSVTVRRSFVNLDDTGERTAVIEFLTQSTNRFVNAFRPRLVSMLRDV